jgi:hypothetical protein
MKRLLVSSTFWNAVIGSGICIVAFHFTDSEGISMAILGLFTAREVSKGAKEYKEVSNGVTFNSETNKHEKI